MAIDAKVRIIGEDDTKRAFNSVKRNIDDTQKRARRMAGAFASVGGGAAFIGLVKQSLKVGDALDKLAKQTGFTVEAIQKYRFAAGQTGVSQENFNKGLQAFTKRMGELKTGSGSLFSFLKKYDEDLLKALQSTTSSEQAFRILSDAMSGIGDAGTQAALGAAAFSRGAGVEMAQTLAIGTTGLDEYGQQLEKTGSIMGETATGGAASALDAIDKLSKSTIGLATVFAAELGPTISTVADTLRELIPKAFATARLAVTDFLAVIIPGMEAISSAIADGLLAIDRFVKGVLDLPNKAGKAVSDMVSDIGDSIGDLAGGVLDKANEFFEGVTEGAENMYDAVVGSSFVPDMVRGIETWFGKLPDVMEKPAEMATDFVADAFGRMRDKISDILFDVITGVRSFGDALKSIGKQIFENVAKWGIDELLGAIGLGSVSGSVSAGGFGGGIGGQILGSLVGKAIGGIGKFLGLGAGATVTSGAGGALALSSGFAGAAGSPVALAGPGGFAQLSGIGAGGAGGGFGLGGLANPAIWGPAAGFGAIFGLHALGRSNRPSRADIRGRLGFSSPFESLGGGAFGAGIRGLDGPKDYAKSLKGITEVDLKKYFDGVNIVVERFGDELLISNKHYDVLKQAIQDSEGTIVGTFENFEQRAKKAFGRLSQEAQKRLANIDQNADDVVNVFKDGIVTAVEAAELGIEGMGSTTVAVFQQMISLAQAAASAARGIGDISVPKIRTSNEYIRTVQSGSSGGGGYLGDMAAGLLPIPRIARESDYGYLGAQHGGTFTVQGRGGVDANNLRVSSGERLTVETPGQAGKQIELLSSILLQLKRQGSDMARLMAK